GRTDRTRASPLSKHGRFCRDDVRARLALVSWSAWAARVAGITVKPGSIRNAVRRFRMNLDIREEAPTPAALSEHATIPIAFVVDQILEVRLLDGGLGGMALTQTAVTDPYVKDYDALEGAGPQCWPGRFDVSNRGLIGARRDGASVGGAVIATRTPGLHMLGGRDDVAVLWGISGCRRGNGV